MRQYLIMPTLRMRQTTTFLFMSAMLCIALKVQAQAPGEIPSDVVNAKVQARALQFLKAVEKLSPHKDPNDPDASQAFPRANFWRFRNTDNTIGINPRPTKNSVAGGSDSGSSRRGRFWEVSYFVEGFKLSIAVDSSTGAIKRFADSTLTDALHLLPAKDWEDCISADTAVSRAWEYLKNTGLDLSDVVIQEIHPVEEQPFNGFTQNSRKWQIYYQRVYNGVPLSPCDFWVELDATAGRLSIIAGNTERPPIQDCQLNITQAQALERGRALLLQKGNTLIGETTAQLRYSFFGNGWTAKSYKDITFTPECRLSWSIFSFTQNGGYCNVQIDATTGNTTGYSFNMIRGKDGTFIEGGEMGVFLRKAHKLMLTSLSGTGTANKHLAALSPKKQGVKTLVVSPSPVKFYGALSGLIQARSLPKHLTFRPTHSLTISLANGESKTLLFDKHTGYMLYSKGSEKFYLLPGVGLRRWMTL